MATYYVLLYKLSNVCGICTELSCFKNMNKPSVNGAHAFQCDVMH